MIPASMVRDTTCIVGLLVKMCLSNFAITGMGIHAYIMTWNPRLLVMHLIVMLRILQLG